MEQDKKKISQQLATFLLIRKYISKPERNEYETDDRALTKRELDLISKLDEQTHRLHRLQNENNK
ncbi:MAG: hypothetical protein ACK5C5_07095 [Bacteroidota bacterium]|jgi:hypothetical protein